MSLVVPLYPSTAQAVEYFVSPTGTATEGCTRRTPCNLASGVGLAMAGDTVTLMDGVYHESLYVTNTGTPDAWITFRADQCATPIVEGSGAGPNDDVQDSGIGSSVGEYLRFEGIVARGWNIGFGNAWADGVDSDAVSNGHWDIEHCIAYSNGRTGFTFFSAPDFTIRHSISAHNGTSQLHSWSSGVTLFEATGTLLVEGNVSFENSDAQRHTDGSGFIVDEESNGARFINNIAFGNGGSCFRLTKSSDTVFVNNTCYHNSQFGSLATGPDNPSELYFTNGGVTVQNVTFLNNVIVGTGQAPAGQQAVVNQPMSGWTNNVVATGQVGYFTDATGANPSFLPIAGDMALSGQAQAGNDVPTDDIGFDPKCIVQRAPVMVGAVAAESWWTFDVDIQYIQSIGGVAACFNPNARGGTPDIGAYQSGALTTVEPGSCIPPPEPEPEPEPVGVPGAGGQPPGGVGMGTAGMGIATGGAGVGFAGAPSTPGSTPPVSSGTPSATAGATASGGPPATPAPGVSADPTPSPPGAVPTVAVGSEGASFAGASAVPMPSGAGGQAAVNSAGDANDAGGCQCRTFTAGASGAGAWAAGFLALGLLRRRRRSG